jgi:sulfur-carrier protein
MSTPSPASSPSHASSPSPAPAAAGDLHDHVRIALPHQLRRLARVTGEVTVVVAPPATLGAVLDALEAAHPALVGTVRDRATGARRAMIRIYADSEDLTDAPRTTRLPEPVTTGREPLRLVGAIAGG